MKKKISLALLIASPIAIAVCMMPHNSLSVTDGADCSHSGYHYVSNAATPYVEGNSEFWTCCKCHQVFANTSTPSGSWTTRDITNAEGGIPDVAKIARTWEIISDCALDVGDCSFENNTKKINSSSGYTKCTEVDGKWLASKRNINNLILDKYSEIKFSFCTTILVKSYFEVHARTNITQDFANVYTSGTTETSWIEISIKKENGVYNLYTDGNKTALGLAPQSLLSDYVKFQIADGHTFYISELRGYIDLESYNSYKVSDKVLKDSSFDNRNQVSTLSISQHHKTYDFVNFDLTNYNYLYFYVQPTVNCYWFATTNSDAGDTDIKVGKHLVELIRTSSNWNIYYDGSLMTTYTGSLERTGLNLNENLSFLKFMANATAIGQPFTFSPLFASDDVFASSGGTPYKFVYYSEDFIEGDVNKYLADIQNAFQDSTGATLSSKELKIDDFSSKTTVKDHPFSDSLSQVTEPAYVHTGDDYSSKISKKWASTANTHFASMTYSSYSYLEFFVLGGNTEKNQWFEIKYNGTALYSFDGIYNATWHSFKLVNNESSWELLVDGVSKSKSIPSPNNLDVFINGTYYVSPVTTSSACDPYVDTNECNIVLGKSLAMSEGLLSNEMGDKNFAIKYIDNSVFIYGDTEWATYLGVNKFMYDLFGYEYFSPGVNRYIKNMNRLAFKKANYESSLAFDNAFNVDGEMRRKEDRVEFSTHMGVTYNYTDLSLVYSLHNESAYAASSYYCGSDATKNGHINLADTSNAVGIANYLYNSHVKNYKRNKLCFALNDDLTWYDSTDPSQYSNQYFHLINLVAEELDKLVDYDITLYGLAYNQVVKAPTTSGFSFYRGNHVNVSVWYAPVQANWYQPLNHAVNKLSTYSISNQGGTYSPYDEYIKWSNLCTDGIKMGLFSYSTYIDSNFVPLGATNAFQANYQFAKEHNTGFVYEMGQYDNNVQPDWGRLKIYLKYEYFKDPYQSQDLLLAKYFTANYGAAASKMLEFYNAEMSLISAAFTSKGTSDVKMAFGALHAGKVNAQCYYWNEKNTKNAIALGKAALDMVSDQATKDRISLELLALQYLYVRCCTNNYGSGKGFWTNSLGYTFQSISNEAIRLGVNKMGEGQDFGVLS